MIELASRRYVAPTPAWLAASIARAYRMYDITEVQRINTDEALRLLESSLSSESWARLALPHVFVAYTRGSNLDDADKERHKRVVSVIRSVVTDCSGSRSGPERRGSETTNERRTVLIEATSRLGATTARRARGLTTPPAHVTGSAR